jgi:hypothetical protein
MTTAPKVLSGSVSGEPLFDHPRQVSVTIARWPGNFAVATTKPGGRNYTTSVSVTVRATQPRRP